MLDIIIIIFLVMGFLIGLRRGFIMQVIRLVSTVLAFAIAFSFAGKVAPSLQLWIPFPTIGTDSFVSIMLGDDVVQKAFYYLIAFAIIFFGAKLVLFFIGSMLDFIAQIPVLKQVNSLAGGALGIVETYLLVFVLLIVASKVPIESIQSHMQGSVLSSLIVEHTPIISDSIKKFWI